MDDFRSSWFSIHREALGIAGSRMAVGWDPVELEPSLSAIAQAEITDQRVSWVVGDGGDWLLDTGPADRFDLVFADTWPGKFTHLGAAIGLVEPGGFYVIDDLLPQPNWPDGHQLAVDRLTARLQSHPELATVRLDWGSGVMVCTRTAEADPDA